MKTEGHHSLRARISKANSKFGFFQEDLKQSPEVNILKEWHKNMMPNYEKAEVWLDDSIEPIKWQDSKLHRWKGFAGLNPL